MSPRIEINVTREVKVHLEKLRREASEKTGHSVSMTSLVSAILEEALSRLPVEEHEEEKDRIFLLRSSLE